MMIEQKSKFPLSVMILTRNESQNVARCLACLEWADDVILIDSESTDDTVGRAIEFRSDIRVFSNAFEDFGQQRNWALDNTDPRHEWVLFVDADERINNECARAIQVAVNNPGHRVGFFLCYRNIFLGRWIKRCTLFPSWQLRLLHRGRVRYQKEGHGQREVIVDGGTTDYIDVPYDHLPASKGMRDWIFRHTIYATQEAELLIRLRSEPLRLSELFGSAILRRRCLKRIAARLGEGPFAWFVYLYLVRLGFLDGRPGFIFCLLRSAQFIHVKAILAEAEARGKGQLEENERQ